jgi:hypothetical protein
MDFRPVSGPMSLRDSDAFSATAQRWKRRFIVNGLFLQATVFLRHPNKSVFLRIRRRIKELEAQRSYASLAFRKVAKYYLADTAEQCDDRFDYGKCHIGEGRWLGSLE